MNLSPHFTLEEMTLSQTAARLGLDNTPPQNVIDNLRRTAIGLELVRNLVGCPISVSSGYRSPLVNKAVGGATNPPSQHTTGQAADITAPGFGSADALVRAIVASQVPYDQVIREFDSWCHISFSSTPRRQALIIDHSGKRAFT